MRENGVSELVPSVFGSARLDSIMSLMISARFLFGCFVVSSFKMSRDFGDGRKLIGFDATPYTLPSING